MSAVSKLFLLILVMFIRFSCGIRCYHCMSKEGGFCDDPFDKDCSDVKELDCPSEYNACVTAKGTATCKNNSLSV